MPIDASEVKWNDSAPSNQSDSPDPKSVTWNQPDPTTAPFNANPKAGMTHATAPKAQSLGQMLYPEVDFDTGLPFLDQTHLAQVDNFDEKKAYLEKVYGKKNVEVAPAPDGKTSILVVTKDGKKIAADGGEALKGITADAVGSAPIWSSMGAGALGGAEAGSLFGPLGAGVGGLMGAAAGGMFGKTAVEGEKAVEGTYRKTPEEYASTMVDTAKTGAESELGGGLASKAISKVLRGPLPELITQTTPESRGLTERALAGGARPPAESTVPGAKKLAWTEALARKTVSGVRSQDAANSSYVANRMRSILEDSGVPPDQLEPLMRELEAGDAQVPTEEIGEHVKKRIQAHQEILEQNVQARLSSVNADIDKASRHLDTLTQRFNPGDLGVDVAEGIRQARTDFGTAMRKVYQKIDSLVGDQPLVDTSIPQREAAAQGRRLPKTGQPALQQETAALGQPASADDAALYASLGLSPPTGGKVSFGDAQRFRTEFRMKADELSLTRDPRAGAAGKMADMWDYAIQASSKDPAAAPAVKLLNAADKAYSQGIKRFNDVTVKRLVKNMEAGLTPDPEEVARQIIQPGQEARVKEIRQLVGESTWKNVAGADYSRMIRAATDETGKVDGSRFLEEIRTRRTLMPVVYGDKLAGQIEELAKTIAARDDKIPVEALKPGAIQRTLESLKSAEAAQDRFMKENYLGLLGNPRRNPEAVYRWLVKPDNAAALREAVKLFGEGSPELSGLRQGALKELMSQAKMNYADGRGATALSDALAKYTPDQQKLLFPNGMDSDLNLLGKEIQFIMKTHGDESKASFAAGAILALPFAARIPVQVGIGVVQTLLSQPTVIRYLALGLRQPPGPARAAARRMLENLVRFGSLAPSLGSNQGAPQNEQGDIQNAIAGGTGGP